MYVGHYPTKSNAVVIHSGKQCWSATQEYTVTKVLAMRREATEGSFADRPTHRSDVPMGFEPCLLSFRQPSYQSYSIYLQELDRISQLSSQMLQFALSLTRRAARKVEIDDGIAT